MSDSAQAPPPRGTASGSTRPDGAMRLPPIGAPGLRLLEPGVVLLPVWRPDPDSPEPEPESRDSAGWCGVAVKE